MIKKTQKDLFLEAIRGGMNISDACSLAGVSRDWYYDGIKKNPAFAAEIENAQTVCKKRSVDIIQKAAKKTWQAAAWWLERKHREEFGQKVEHSGDLNLNVKQVADLVRKARAARGLTID